MSSYYSTPHVRRALGKFFFGKALGATIGITTLLLLVRLLPVEDYGLYVALVGYLEIFIDLSSVGIVAASERLIPESRAAGDEGRLRRLIVRLALLRLASVVFASAVVAVLAMTMGPRLGFGAQVATLLIFQVVVAAETLARFAESIFESLLMQGRSQVSLMLRTGLRMFFLLSVWGSARSIALEDWLAYEAAAYVLGMLCTYAMVVALVRALPVAAGPTGLRAVWRPSIQLYGAQVVGAMTGVDMVKMLVVKTQEPVAAAAFGFCATLAWMIQRYLPSYLLIGLVRPLIVAAVSEGATAAVKLSRMVSVLLKLNGVLLCMGVAVTATCGDWLLFHLSGGKVSGAGMLMTLMLCFVLSGSVRNVYGHIGLATGLGWRMLVAQSMAALVLLAGLTLSFLLGTVAFPIALITMNILWAWLVLRRLAELQQLPAFRPRGIALVLVTCFIAALCGMTLNRIVFTVDSASSVIGGAIATLAFLGAMVWLRPFEPDERESVNGILPRPWFIL